MSTVRPRCPHAGRQLRRRFLSPLLAQSSFPNAIWRRPANLIGVCCLGTLYRMRHVIQFGQLRSDMILCGCRGTSAFTRGYFLGWLKR